MQRPIRSCPYRAALWIYQWTLEYSSEYKSHDKVQVDVRQVPQGKRSEDMDEKVRKENTSDADSKHGRGETGDGDPVTIERVNRAKNP